MPVPRATYRLPVRVYYKDTDAAGVVYNANYLRFMERARVAIACHDRSHWHPARIPAALHARLEAAL